MKLKVYHGIEKYDYENCVNIQTHCNNCRNTFHFECREWYSYNTPGIIT